MPLVKRTGPAGSYPKTVLENLKYRQQIVQDAQAGKIKWEELKLLGHRDPLWWVNTWLWVYEPRHGETPVPGEAVIPFVTWPFQDTVLLDLWDAITLGGDRLVDKSRGMGATWTILAAFFWRWYYCNGDSFLLVSRNADYVDKSGDPKTLFWKFDHLLKYFPLPLRPRIYRVKMHCENVETGSVVDGESTTGEVARGDRRTAIMLDEFPAFEQDDGYKALASTRDATECRIFNGTTVGPFGAFYDIKQKGEIKRLEMWWWDHPTKAKGLYADVAGRRRSPWYDEQVRRSAHPIEIARELDGDDQNAVYSFFDTNMLAKYEGEHCKDPLAVLDWGDLCQLIPTLDMDRKAQLQLWQPLGECNRPVPARYVIAADIAEGTGASNSCLSIGRRDTFEKVAELASPDIGPGVLAKLAVGLCNVFTDGSGLPAMLAWEANGPGQEFWSNVRDLGFTRIYYNVENTRDANPMQGERPGFWTSEGPNGGRALLLRHYRRALAERLFKNPSQPAVRECRDYLMESGRIVHTKSKKAVDPTGARESHGDRVIADAILDWVMRDGLRNVSKGATLPKKNLTNTLRWRMLEVDRQEQLRNQW